MKPIRNATVLITGGSKGIGFAIAEEFARHKHNLILIARDHNKLQQAAQKIKQQTNVNVKIFATDLIHENAPLQLFDNVKEAGMSGDILVNNAGEGMTGSFAQSDYSRMTSMLQLNMLALSQLTHLFLQQMLERKRGRILNIGSVVAYFSGAPNWSAYVASKHYVLAFTKGLSRELKGTGVVATVVSPGTTATDFIETANATNMRAYQAPGGVSVDRVAKTAYQACQSGKASVTPGLLNKILAFMGELHPRVSGGPNPRINGEQATRHDQHPHRHI